VGRRPPAHVTFAPVPVFICILRTQKDGLFAHSWLFILVLSLALAARFVVNVWAGANNVADYVLWKAALLDNNSGGVLMLHSLLMALIYGTLAHGALRVDISHLRFGSLGGVFIQFERHGAVKM